MPIAANKAPLAILVATAFAVLAGLGIWQLQRRDWKAAIVSRLAHSLVEVPQPYVFPGDTASQVNREFQRVRVRGRFIGKSQQKLFTPTPSAVTPKTQDGFGYLVFQLLDTGRGIVFVNRGFVPQQIFESGSVEAQGEEVAVEGILRLATSGNWLTPAPDLSKRLFFSADIAAMGANAKQPGDRIVLTEYIEAAPSQGARGWPVARDPAELLASIPNNHLQYALTWFGLAAGLTGVYLLYAVRK